MIDWITINGWAFAGLDLNNLMAERLSTNPYWLLFLLVLIFQTVVWLKGRVSSSLLNPTLVTTVVIIAYLVLTQTPYRVFEQAGSYITFWLQPAVVCLAVPLYVQWQKIKSQWLAIMLSQLVGSVVGIVSGVWFVRLLGGTDTVAISVVAKSVTMPIAIEIVNNIGGIMGVTIISGLIAGITGQMMSLGLFALTRQRRPMGQSIAIGTASHAVGIASIMPMGERFVAYGTVGLIVNGILTAFFAPVIVPLLL